MAKQWTPRLNATSRGVGQVNGGYLAAGKMRQHYTINGVSAISGRRGKATRTKVFAGNCGSSKAAGC